MWIMVEDFYMGVGRGRGQKPENQGSVGNCGMGAKAGSMAK
jgi:hypothetical protein